jgi:hypothetical protein
MKTKLYGVDHGSSWNFGFCFWTRGICSCGKTNKDPKRKRNSRTELQGRVIHCSNTLSDSGVISNGDLYGHIIGNFTINYVGSSNSCCFNC